MSPVLAQQVSESPAPTGAPLAYYVITSAVAALALIVSLFNLWWTQRKNDDREYSKWKRDTLTKTTVDFIKLSTQRSRYVSDYVSSFSPHKRLMKFDDQSGFKISSSSILATFEICEAEDLYIEAQSIISLHKQSEEPLRQFVIDNSIKTSRTVLDDIGNILGYINKIETHHQALVTKTKMAVQTTNKWSPQIAERKTVVRKTK